jgi:hypothetical protein
MGLYVAKDRNRTVISRTGLRVADGRRVRRAWGALAEERVPGHQVRTDPRPPMVALVGLPPIVVVLAGLYYMGPYVAFVGGALVLLLAVLIVPRLVRRRPLRVPAGEGVELTSPAERTAFDRSLDTADRVASTWPALDGLIDRPEAEAQLSDALWEIAGVLARRQELRAVLAQLTRPDFATAAPDGETAAKLQAQIRATKEALSAVEIDLAGREASLRHAEEAGRTFIRERDMLEAIRAAERSLGAASSGPALSSASAASAASAAEPARDPAADLAEHTHLVLAAYRELTTTLHPDSNA